jgi:hypothetical protein
VPKVERSAFGVRVGFGFGRAFFSLFTFFLCHFEGGTTVLSFVLVAGCCPGDSSPLPESFRVRFPRNDDGLCGRATTSIKHPATSSTSELSRLSVFAVPQTLNFQTLNQRAPGNQILKFPNTSFLYVYVLGD